MARSYGDSGYGSRKILSMASNGSMDGTYQSAVDIIRHTFMFPVTVKDWNLSLSAGGTDFTNLTLLAIGKSLGGTGSVTAFGTCDILGATGTHASASVIDASATETSFTAGDDVVFQMTGTVGHALSGTVHIEYVETFENADS